MRKILSLINKALAIIVRRFRSQGILVTLLWLYGRGLPAITGVPLLQYSRVTPNLFVGPQFNARGKKALEIEGINGSVNMRIERDDAAHGLALQRYLHLPTIDDDAVSMEHLEQGIQFIRGVISDGGKVYIHCGAGVGRAPTMAAAYLIAEGYTLDEALVLIRKVRPFIAITQPQMTRLQEIEQQYLSSRATSATASIEA